MEMTLATLKMRQKLFSTEMSKIGEAMAKQGATDTKDTTAEPQSDEIKDAEVKDEGEKK